LSTSKILVHHGASLDTPNARDQTCRKTYEDLLKEEFEQLKKETNESNTISLGGVSIQIASDLHLEFYGDKPIDYSKIIVPSAPILALLGDIGIPKKGDFIYRDFLLSMADQFKLVLVVAGNHEYYHCKNEKVSVEQVNEHIQEICNLHPKLKFMNQTSLLVNGVRILGCSLWSYIPPKAYDVCEMSLNDYNLILTKNSIDKSKLVPLTAEKSSSWFESDIKWIQDEITKSKQNCETARVILTHHTPSFSNTSAPMYTTHPWKSHPEDNDGTDRLWVNCCFSSDVENLFGKENVNVWAYGHTHYNNDQIVNGTRLLSNQRGYLFHMEESYSPRLSFFVSS